MPSIEPVNFTNGLSISLTLWAEATQYLNEVTQQIDETTQTKNTRFMSQVYGGDNLSAFSDRRYVQDVVRQYGYELNDERFGAYVRAILYSPTSRRGVMASYIIIAFHSIGDSSTGVMVASALFKTRDADDATPIARELFSFTTNETENSVRERFKPWLDEVILLGLDEWHKRL